MRRLFFTFGLLFTFWSLGVEALDIAQLKKFRSAVCSIYVNANRSAYGDPVSWQGTGFICDKKRGIICTNHHVVGRGGVVGTYDIEFVNGQKVEARLLYADPWHDFAFLEIATPSLIPEAVQELNTFSEPKLGESIFIAGNNQVQSFSFQEGRVSVLYTNGGFMPEPSFGCLVNAVGGSSGSPVVNDQLEVVGINFAGFGDGRCLEIRSRVLKEALSHLQQGRLPPRRHIGVMVSLTSLEPQIKLLQFPQKVAKKYLKDYPTASFRVLEVIGTLRGSPAEGVFEIGDVLVSVNGKIFGPDLAAFEKILNEAQGDFVQVGFYREGQFLEKKVPLYNLHDFSIKRLVVFGGMTFFEADDLMRWQYGVKPHQVMSMNVLPGSSFAPLVQELGGQLFLMEEESIDALLGTLSAWLIKREFFFYFRVATPVNSGYDQIFFVNRFKRKAFISYEASQNLPPELLEWSFKEREWKTRSLMCELVAGG
jgi:S1-C subfamily serine protease